MAHIGEDIKKCGVVALLELQSVSAAQVQNALADFEKAVVIKV